MSRPSCTAAAVVRSGISVLSGMVPLITAGGNIVDAAGNRYRITGTSVGGFEAVLQLDGTWNYPYRSITIGGVAQTGIIDRLAAAGFNCIRMLICEDVCTPGTKPMVYVNPTLNPDFFADPNNTATVLDGVQILDQVVGYAGSLGLRVIFDMHALAPNGNNAVATAGLWYTTATPAAPSSPRRHTAADTRNEADWIGAWTALAARYAGNPIVIGADLVNEPWAASWGDGNPNTDIAAAYTRCGNAILAVNPGWLIFCEGIYEVLNFGPQNGGWVGVGWGAGLDLAANYPVVLNPPNQVVYSPHEYGPGIGGWNYFNAPGYPANMPAVWNQMYGYLVKNNTAPVWIGEVGDFLALGANGGSETAAKFAQAQQWFATLMAYAGGQTSTGGTPDVPPGCLGFSWSWFCWSTNGYAGSPGSIANTNLLMGDFNTLNTNLLQYITPYLAPLMLATVPVAVVLALSAPARTAASVHWATQDGTALAGVHYVAASGVVGFAVGDASASVTVQLRPVSQGGKTLAFSVVLSQPMACSLPAPVVAVTIGYA